LAEDAISTSDAYGRTAQVALLGEQATVLAQAMENERDLYAGFAAYGILAADALANRAAPSVTKPISTAEATSNANLMAAEKATNAEGQRVETLAAAIGPAFPAGIQTKAQSVITMIESIPGLRSALVGDPAAQVIATYSSSIGDLFVLNDEITSGSGDASLSDEVRALGALSRAKDQASQQRAFVYSTLIETSVNDTGDGKRAPSNDVKSSQALQDAGGLGVLTTSQGLEFADLTDFNGAATTEQSNAYLATVAGAQANDAQLIEGFLSLPNDPRLVFERIGNQTSLGDPQATVAATWYSDETAVVSQMRSIESQVMTAIVTRSQALEHGDGLVCVDASRDVHRERLAGELVNDVEQFHCPTVVGDVDDGKIGEDTFHAALTSQRQRAMLDDLRAPVLGGVLHHHEDLLHAVHQVHRPAHTLDHLAGDRPVGQVAGGRHLHGAQHRDVEVSAADDPE